MRTSPSKASRGRVLLGNNAWKIRRVESGRVRVEDAHGQPPTIPFWLGEAPGRTTELSDEVTELREGIDQLLPDSGAAREWVVTESGVDAEASRQLVAYIEEGKRVLGVTPSKNRVIAERFFDESGGMQLVIHAPFGARINRAWGMALRKKICRSFDFELQAVATDDGLNFSLGPGLSMPVEDIFQLPEAQHHRGSADAGGVAGAHIRHPLALERHPRPGNPASHRRQEGAAAAATDALRRPAGRGVPGPRWPARTTRRPATSKSQTIRWCSRPCATA